MKNLWKALLLVRRCHPWSFRRRLFYELLQSILPLVNLYLLKLLIDTVQMRVAGQAEPSSYLIPLLSMCGIFLLNRILSALSAINNDLLSQRLIDHLSDLIQHQSARLDMQYYDTPAFHDTLHRAQQEASYRPLQILANFMTLAGSLLSIAGIIALLLSASSWVIAIMIVAVLPGFALRLYKARRIYRFRRDNTQLYRRTSYYASVLTATAFAKELRAFDLAKLFRRRFVDTRRTLVSHLLSISRRLGTLDILCAFIETGATLAVLSLFIGQAFAGTITIGTFVMLFEAFRRGQGYLQNLVTAISGLYDNRLFVANLFEFLQLQPHILPTDNPLPMPHDINTVTFSNVTFRYPDMDHNVLENFSLTAAKGQITRIDGRNGFGKSTLVKLLLRLYDPDQGSILLDGTDIRLIHPQNLRAGIGVLFQDFVRFNCTAHENISFGTHNATLPPLQPTPPILDFIDRLPQKEHTLLGRLFDGGSELSMGQWQRLAIARALASDSPILILDEPTAWLDNHSRQQLSALLQQLKKTKIIILITHSQDLDL